MSRARRRNAAKFDLNSCRLGRVVVWRRGMAPVIGRAEQAWRRRDVRTAHGARPGRIARLWTQLGDLVARGRAWRPRRTASSAHQVPAGVVVDQLPGDGDWPTPDAAHTAASNGTQSGRWN